MAQQVLHINKESSLKRPPFLGCDIVPFGFVSVMDFAMKRKSMLGFV